MRCPDCRSAEHAGPDRCGRAALRAARRRPASSPRRRSRSRRIRPRARPRAPSRLLPSRPADADRPGRARQGLRLRQGHRSRTPASRGASAAPSAATRRTSSSPSRRPRARTLVDTGAPTVSLTLARTGGYRERGRARERLAVSPGDCRPHFGGRACVRRRGRTRGGSRSRSAAQAEAASRRRAKRDRAAAPAFAVAGAPKEPLDEITLPARARAARRLGRASTRSRPRRTSTTGSTSTPGSSPAPASAGPTATRRSSVLIAVDREVERAWGVGSKSRAEAEQALAEVRKRTTVSRVGRASAPPLACERGYSPDGDARGHGRS